MKSIHTPLSREVIQSLHCGDQVLLSGEILTARDAAHKRIVQMLEAGESLPFSIQNEIVYYMGPTPSRPGQVIGAAGPTTSSRLDAYSPTLIARGLIGMIGKGKRDEAVVEAIVKYGGVYFGAGGGLGALMSACIVKAQVIAFDDLGTEAVRRLEVSNMPLTVLIDSLGNDLYKQGREDYLKSQFGVCRQKEWVS